MFSSEFINGLGLQFYQRSVLKHITLITTNNSHNTETRHQTTSKHHLETRRVFYVLVANRVPCTSNVDPKIFLSSPSLINLDMLQEVTYYDYSTNISGLTYRNTTLA